MLIDNDLDELKKRESALTYIDLHLKRKGRQNLFDLTGLSGGFLLKKDDLKLLETYIGPAVFEKMLDKYGKDHLGGEKVLGFNRTSAGILATILALVKKDTTVVHYLPELPSHPSIPRSSKLVGAEYLEFDRLSDFFLADNTSLVIITGSTMDHKVIPVEEFQAIIKKTHKSSTSPPVMVDDASGARLRTAIFKQPSAWDLGADLIITSTDKLMKGPRGGLMTGKASLISKIKSKAHQYGLEAQGPIMAGMVRALQEFHPENISTSLEKKRKLLRYLKSEWEGFKETPTGVMISAADIALEVDKRNIKTSLSDRDLAFLWAMILLKEYGIITIPAVGMPGASPTLRIDLSSADAQKLKIVELNHILRDSFKKLLQIAPSPQQAESMLFKDQRISK